MGKASWSCPFPFIPPVASLGDILSQITRVFSKAKTLSGISHVPASGWWETCPGDQGITLSLTVALLNEQRIELSEGRWGGPGVKSLVSRRVRPQNRHRLN